MGLLSDLLGGVTPAPPLPSPNAGGGQLNALFGGGAISPDDLRKYLQGAGGSGSVDPQALQQFAAMFA
jgi:hypothetical protein